VTGDLSLKRLLDLTTEGTATVTAKDWEGYCQHVEQQKKITTVEFVLDLGLMCDTLQELFELSLELQKCNINLYGADNKI
jgi:hypothetical protein